MKVHILRHSDGTPAGLLPEWLKSHGYQWKTHNLHRGEPLPLANEIDWLIILGGCMNADEESKYPWLALEKNLIAELLVQKKRVLGLCLGGQLMARALGAAVRKHKHWEVGWHEVELAQNQKLKVFQFHQDTFDIPNGAHHFASNAITPNQGFRYGSNAVGLQFHPEATAEWVRECAEERDFPSGPHVQSPEEILAQLHLLEAQREWFFNLLSEIESATPHEERSHVTKIS
jgi:GMP synthase-like glutamine amidotransferase